MCRTACTEPQCLYKGALYLTSVIVQGPTLPYLSACTRVHFAFTLEWYFPSALHVSQQGVIDKHFEISKWGNEESATARNKRFKPRQSCVITVCCLRAGNCLCNKNQQNSHFFHSSIHPSIHPSHPSIHPSIHLYLHLSVHLPTLNNSTPAGRIFMKFNVWIFFTVCREYWLFIKIWQE